MTVRQRPLISPTTEDKADSKQQQQQRQQQQQQSLVNTSVNSDDPFSAGEGVHTYIHITDLCASSFAVKGKQNNGHRQCSTGKGLEVTISALAGCHLFNYSLPLCNWKLCSHVYKGSSLSTLIVTV